MTDDWANEGTRWLCHVPNVPTGARPKPPFRYIKLESHTAYVLAQSIPLHPPALLSIYEFLLICPTTA